jgi:hypothetical protein
MPLDFPSSPLVGDLYTYNNRTWQYNGSAWALLATSSINNTPIGNVQANTGAFTSITASGTVTATGNVTGDWLNANQVSSLGNITATGNVSANFLLGNGACITGVAVTVSNIVSGNSNVAVTTANGNIAISVAGNSNVAVFSNGDTTLKANFVPIADNVYSLGSSSLRWANLWMAGNTIILGNVVLRDTGGNAMGVYGADGTTPGQFLNTSGYQQNPANITVNTTLPTSYNNFSAGPVTINSNVTVTVASGAFWTIA